MLKPTEKRFKFTEAKIARLPFAEHGTRYTVYDDNVKNLILRVGEKTKVYYMLKKFNGKTIYSTIGNTKAISLSDAYKILSEMQNDILHGKNPNQERQKIRDNITIKDFFENIYFPRHALMHKKIRSQNEDKSCYNLYLGPIKNCKMMDITRNTVSVLQQQIAESHGIYAANHTMRLLRAMYNKAIDWGYVGENPVMRVKLFKEIKRDRFLQPDEIPRFFNALAEEPNTMFRNFCMLCLLVGQRRSNMQSIKWSDIDFDNRIIRIPETKTGKPQNAYLSDQAIDILKEMQLSNKKDHVWLFPSAFSKSGHLENPAKMWQNLLNRARVSNLRIHDLRRTFASYQAINGASNTIIGKSIGDTSPTAISIYARVTEDPIRQSIQTATDHMFSFIKPKDK